MRTLRQRGWAPAALALSATLALPGITPLRAEEKAVQKPSASALGAALQMTRTRGVATVAVVTSPEQPASVQIWKEFYEGGWARTNRGSVELVNVSKDTDPGLIRALNVSHFPTAIVYTRGPQGVRALGTITDCNTAEDLVSRLRTLDLGLNLPAKADQAVTATAFSSDGYASGQSQCPAPAYCPPTTALAPQPQTTTLSVAPTQSLQATANVIQMPSQNLMIQQAPPQIFLAPSQAPIVYVPQTLNAAPAMTLSAGPAPSAPAGNLFLATPTLSAAPAQQPTLALATSAPAAAPAATLALAANPGPLATVNNQTLSLPTSGNRTRVRVRGPGMLASSLARLGERMTRLGRSRIETINETTLEPPLNQGPSLGMATISTTSTQPLAQGPTLSVSPPQQPCDKPSCPANSPPSNLPSPQKQYSHGH